MPGYVFMQSVNRYPRRFNFQRELAGWEVEFLFAGWGIPFGRGHKGVRDKGRGIKGSY